MGRSPGFGSTACNLFALLRLGFPAASHLKCLTLLQTVTRWFVLQKARGHTLGAPTACKHRVSGSISLPFRGSFHLSLTVLSSIGHQGVFSLGGWSPLLPTGFHVSRGTLEIDSSFLFFAYEAFTLYGLAFQLYSAKDSRLLCLFLNPSKAKLYWFGLFPFRSPLLRESSFLSLPQGT